MDKHGHFSSPGVGDPAQRLGVCFPEEGGLGAIVKASADELGVHVFLDGAEECPLSEGAIFVVDD